MAVLQIDLNKPHWTLRIVTKIAVSGSHLIHQQRVVQNRFQCMYPQHENQTAGEKKKIS